MNDAFHDLVPLHKPREQLLKKKWISFLLLMTLAALFVTSTAACARSNMKIGDGPPTTDLLRRIFMLDKTHGWALTNNLILKTQDGGLHWQDVTPTHANLNFNGPDPTEGDFLNDQDAWVATPSVDSCAVIVLYTTDGGKSWQSSTAIPLFAIEGPSMTDFVNPSDGWLKVTGSPGAGTLPSVIFHTTDGGQHWNELANSLGNDASGIFFSSVQNGWQLGEDPNRDTQPWLWVTHDAGQTWDDVPLPELPGAGTDDLADPMPPVLFGKNGLLPVQDLRESDFHAIGLDLYMTHDSGQTWTPTTVFPLKGDYPATVDVVDMYHVWAAGGTNLYATSDSGQSWTELPQPPQAMSKLDFLDANNGWAINTTTDPTKKQPPNLMRTTDGGNTWQSISYSIVGKSTAPLSTANGSENYCPPQ